MLRSVRLAALAAIMLAAPAAAQNIVIQPRPAAPADGKGDVRVNVSTGFFVAAPSGDNDAAIKAQEQARRVIYESAARECELLRATIAGACRLESVNININANRAYGNQGPDGFNASGNFAFRIKLK